MAHLPGLAFDLGETIARCCATASRSLPTPSSRRAPPTIDRDNLFPADRGRSSARSACTA